MIEATQVMDDERKARSRDDHLPEFGKMSLAEVGLALVVLFIVMNALCSAGNGNELER